MDELSKKIKELLTRKSSEGFIFEGIEDHPTKTLDEFFSLNDREDYIWESDLEDSLYNEEDLNESASSQEAYKVGDIIMTKRFESRGKYIENSPHRILIVTSKEVSDGVTQYKGFLLSSKMDKANKNGGYPNNIYINDYSTIIYSGSRPKQEAFIRVDDLVSLTSEDLALSGGGNWKGKATYEFMNFVQSCYNNYRNHRDNSKVYWEK